MIKGLKCLLEGIHKKFGDTVSNADELGSYLVKRRSFSKTEVTPQFPDQPSVVYRRAGMDISLIDTHLMVGGTPVVVMKVEGRANSSSSQAYWTLTGVSELAKNYAERTAA